MNKKEAIKKLEELKQKAETLISMPIRNSEFEKWHRDTQIAIKRIFGRDATYLDEFNNVDYILSVFSDRILKYEFEKSYQNGIKRAITILDSFIDEIRKYWDESNEDEDNRVSALENIKLIIKRFHKVATQLRERYSARETLEIKDEYDIQDLFHALLKLFFDDIKREEYTPSYAGASLKVNFLLKKEKIIIEIKKTRKGLGAKEIKEQLMVDTVKYQSHPDCNLFVCFVYDPEGYITNPWELEHNLSKEINGIPVSVFITPEI